MGRDITNMAFLILLLPLLLLSATSVSQDQDPIHDCPTKGKWCANVGEGSQIHTGSWQDCGKMCMEDGNCNYWSYANIMVNNCALHSECDFLMDEEEAYSGKKGCP